MSCLAIVGSTASGKSSLALALANRVAGVELVSIDSMQVYRGMDIGTATPTAAERATVPHHLLDLVEPSHEFSVAEFQAAYRAAIGDIEARGGRPVLVGGTGLYHRAVIDDLELPGQWPEVADRLHTELDRDGVEALYARLVECDPAAAAKMESNNTRRILRALEVCEGSGRRFSSFGVGLDTYPPSSVIQVGLRWDRAALAERIEARVYAMVEAGLVDEVRGLVRSGLSKTAAQALGYKEMIAHLEGRSSLEEAIDQIIIRTRQFSVRQERWFRRDPRVRWIDITADPVGEALDLVVEIMSDQGRSESTPSGDNDLA